MGRSNAVDKPGLPLFEQELESLVGLLRRAEAGELAHRPEPAAVHTCVHAACERILTRPADIDVVVEIARGVQGRDRPPADGRGGLLANGRPGLLFLRVLRSLLSGLPRRIHARILSVRRWLGQASPSSR